MLKTKLSMPLLSLCLVITIVSCAVIVSAEGNFMTPLDSAIEDVTGSFDKLAEISNMAGDVKDTAKYTAIAYILTNFDNGEIITSRERFNEIAKASMEGGLKSWIQLTNGRTVAINESTLASYKDWIDSRMYFIIKHEVEMKTKEVKLGEPTGDYKLTLQQIDVIRPNHYDQKFTLKAVPEGYVFEGESGINRIRALIADAKGELVGKENRIKVRWYDPSTQEYVTAAPSSLDAGSTFRTHRKNIGKPLKFQFATIRKGSKIHEIIFNDVHHINNVKVSEPSAIDEIVGTWNVMITPGIQTTLVIEQSIGESVFGKFITPNGTYKVTGTLSRTKAGLKLGYADAVHIQKDLQNSNLPKEKLPYMASQLLNTKNFHRELTFTYTGAETALTAKYRTWETIKYDKKTYKIKSVSMGKAADKKMIKVVR